MASAENTGTRNGIKEQYENMKSLSGGRYFSSSPYFFLRHRQTKGVKMMYKNVEWNDVRKGERQ